MEIKKTLNKEGRTYALFGLIPVHWQYKIEDEKLPGSFTASNQFEKKNYQISDSQAGSVVTASNGDRLFYVQKKSATTFEQPEKLSILLRVIAIILLMVFINALAAGFSVERNFLTGFVFLSMVVVSLRTITYFFLISHSITESLVCLTPGFTLRVRCTHRLGICSSIQFFCFGW